MSWQNQVESYFIFILGGATGQKVYTTQLRCFTLHKKKVFFHLRPWHHWGYNGLIFTFSFITNSQSQIGSVTAPCNANCSCSIANIDPVCGEDNLSYFSPCHAGCSKVEGSKVWNSHMFVVIVSKGKGISRSDRFSIAFTLGTAR